MAEGLKVMALEGHGVAFLPHSAVKKELRSSKLVSAAPPEMKGLEMTMEVRAYREKPMGREAPKGAAQALWAYLAANAARSAGARRQVISFCIGRGANSIGCPANAPLHFAPLRPPLPATRSSTISWARSRFPPTPTGACTPRARSRTFRSRARRCRPCRS